MVREYHRSRYHERMNDAATTRKRSRHAYVLVVHDGAIDVRKLVARLRTEYVVRESGSAFDALGELAARNHACVVCYVGGRVQAEDFRSLVSAVAKQDAAHIIFVATATTTPDDFECMEKMGRHWVEAAASPDEIAALVRAVSA